MGVFSVQLAKLGSGWFRSYGPRELWWEALFLAIFDNIV